VRLITFTNHAASAVTLSWTADQDYVAVACAGANGVISLDPSLTAAGWRDAPAANLVFDKWVLDCGNFWQIGFQLAFPISKGEKIYCACPAVIGTNYLLLEATADLIS